MNVSFEVEAGDWPDETTLETLLKHCADATFEPVLARTVHVLFTNDAEIQLLNRNWRGQDRPTNVLSFPTPEGPLPDGETPHLGDLALAYETVLAEAHGAGKPLVHHISHLVVHGLLHLLDYDHLEDNAAEIMESKEVAILASLGIANPYLT